MPANDTERLFLSAKSAFETGAAIRGGVPVVFPQFSQLGPLPKHGLVRTQPWEVLHVADNAATLRIRETEDTRRLWPHAFEAQLIVKLEDTCLTLESAVTNTDDRPFTLRARCTRICVCTTSRRRRSSKTVAGRQYRDGARDNQISLEDTAVLRFALFEEIDRVYHGPAADVIVREPDRTLTVRQAGFVDTVVWNPGAQMGATLPDLEENGYRRYVCVEAAMADTSVTLEPQATWRGSQILMV